jgi:hypothetical protein
VCRHGPASADIVGVRGLMPVESIDASCGTQELPVQEEPWPARGGRSVEPSSAQLFWAPVPLRQLLRTCVASSPFTRQPWRRLGMHQPLHALAPAGSGAAAAASGAAAGTACRGLGSGASGGLRA